MQSTLSSILWKMKFNTDININYIITLIVTILWKMKFNTDININTIFTLIVTFHA